MLDINEYRGNNHEHHATSSEIDEVHKDKLPGNTGVQPHCESGVAECCYAVMRGCWALRCLHTIGKGTQVQQPS